MRIRVSAFRHPFLDKSLLYREVENIGSLFKIMKNAFDKGANLFSIRVIESHYTCPSCKDQELISLPINKPVDNYYCHFCNKSFKKEEIERD